MRRFILPVGLLAALAFAASGSAATLFVVSGKGWGHGVGMSQWGAYGMARSGATYQQILRHYYAGSDLDTRTGTIRVLLADNRSSVRIGSATEFKVGDRTHAAGNPLVEPTSTGRIRVGGFTRAFDSPVTFRSLDAPVALNGSAYRGRFVVSVVGGRLRVVNVVGLDSYVKGVVTHESLAWWGDVGAQAALEAQAVAARSYALAGPGHCVDGTYCPDTRDQVYGPIATETANGRAAVDATSNRVVIADGGVAKTFFYSSSGGRTANSAHIWGGVFSYLKSEDDPADLRSFGAGQTNPNRSWRVLFSGKELGNRLETPTPTDAEVSSRASGRVRTLTLSGSDWSQVVSGDAPLRSPEFWRSPSSLGLKSGRFWLGVQRLRADKQVSSCDRRVRLFVYAHGVGAVSLEQRRDGSSTWTEIPLRKVDDTHWRANRFPCVSTTYRLRSARAVGPRVHVTVSADLAFNAAQRTDALAGRVNPGLVGETVTVERETASGWSPVATALVAADGTFRATFEVEEGVYRARVVPPASSGLATGYSPPLHVVTS